MNDHSPVLTAAALEAELSAQFPLRDMSIFTVETVEPLRLLLRMRPRAEHLRPGETVAGPTLMTLADTAVYLSILAMRGPETTAVTSSLNIHFLGRPVAADLLADVRLLRLGKRSAVGEVTIRQEEPVAVATVAYTIVG